MTETEAGEHFVERMSMLQWEASRSNPRMLRAMSEICYRFRKGNEAEAEQCLSNYLKWRKETFGGLHDHCITQDKKMLEQLKTNFLRLSPGRLKDGSAILYMSMKDHYPWKFSTADTIKCMHFYLIAAMMVDPDLASSGIVFVNNMANINMKNLDMAFPGAVASVVGRSIPIRVQHIVMINAPTMVKFMLPPIKSVLPGKMIERLHVVQNSELPHLLALPKKYLPVEMGGMVKFDAEYDLQQLVERNWCV